MTACRNASTEPTQHNLDLAPQPDPPHARMELEQIHAGDNGHAAFEYRCPHCDRRKTVRASITKAPARPYCPKR